MNGRNNEAVTDIIKALEKVEGMNLKDLAAELAEFEGVKRKSHIKELIKEMGASETVGAGDDAAVLDVEGGTLLLACDGISVKLMEADPYFAGYCAVLVNVNDMAAMGGRPIALVDTLSAQNRSTAMKIASGVRDASKKFGVPVVGGHFNPDSTYNAIDVSILGLSRNGRVLKGCGAEVGNIIVAAVDMRGRLHPGYTLAWDSTSKKGSDSARKNISLLETIAEEGLASSARDISNAGFIGTIATLLEESSVGGLVHLDEIECPDDISLQHWLKCYPGYGFIFTAEGEKIQNLVAVFEKEGIWAAPIGSVDASSKLIISKDGEEEIIFDFRVRKTKDG